MADPLHLPSISHFPFLIFDLLLPTMSSDDEFVNSGEEDWDAFLSETEWDERNPFRAPTCTTPRCGGSNLHFSGNLSICLDCHCAASSSAFPYTPLRQDSELRLLVVWPHRHGEDENSIRCGLVRCCLDDHVEYEAISYTWADENGDASKKCAVLIDDEPFQVTASCEAVLKRARHRSTLRLLWIDAVCINQDDVDERGHQVRLMPEIYSHAKRVLVFPGEASEEDSLGLYHLPSIKIDGWKWGDDSPDSKSKMQIWKSAQRAARHLFSRRYFTRVWILQEIALAMDPVVIYGRYEIPWVKLRDQIFKSLEYFAGKSVHTYNFNMPLLPPTQPLPKVLTIRTSTILGPRDLLFVLDKARNSQAQDPRDKVFALFGMIQFASSLGYVADYNETVEEAYTRVTVLLASVHGLFSVLARTNRSTVRQTLPAWVPDWSVTGDPAQASLSSKAPQWSSADWAAETCSLTNTPGELLYVPVLPNPDKYEMEIIGAWVCDLGALVYAGRSVQVFAKHGVYAAANDQELELLYRALKLPEGRSLCCYVPSPFEEARSFRSTGDMENELRRLAASDRQLVARELYLDGLFRGNQIFILSDGQDEFSFVGICVAAAKEGLLYSRADSITHALHKAVSEKFLASVGKHKMASQGVRGDDIKSESPSSGTGTGINAPGSLPLRRVAKGDELGTAGYLTPFEPLVRTLTSLRKLSQGREASHSAVKTQPRGQGGAGGWLDAWAERELWGLDAFLQTDEGKRRLAKIDMEEFEDKVTQSYLARHEFKLEEDHLVFERLKFKM